MMGNSVIWLVIMIPVCLLITGFGIYAFRRKKPMWFWAGTEVKPEEITDVPAYNRANGIMWIVYSLVFWIGTAAAAVTNLGELTIAGGVFGSILLMIAYHGILEKYRAKTDRE